MLHFEVQPLAAPAYLVRVENEHGENVCAFNLTLDGPETLVLEGLRGEMPRPSQWRRAMAERFPSAKYVRFQRGSAVLGNITDHELKVR